MRRILIADIGASKGSWVIVAGQDDQYYATSGYHPLINTNELLGEVLHEIHDHVGTVDAVRYYGTGVINNTITWRISDKISEITGCSDVEVHSDMLAAARATSARTAAIVCIIGTGSNSCVYDGTTITRQTPTLGYPHGDEGGGWQIGLSLIKAYLTGRMPSDLVKSFGDIFALDKTAFLETLKDHAAPSRYLASFTTFAAGNQGHPWIKSELLRSIESFVVQHILPYQMNLPVNAVGGVARTFEKVLRDALGQYDIELKSVVKDPIQGLLNFYRNE